MVLAICDFVTWEFSHKDYLFLKEELLHNLETDIQHNYKLRKIVGQKK